MRSRPPWIAEVQGGHGLGFFGPASATWAVNGSLTTFVGGIQALLTQLLHPGALGGVYDHSQFRTDPLGRLNRTIAWLAVTTFGGEEAARSAAERVARLHRRVIGEYSGTDGQVEQYSAQDPDLALWVHSAFTSAFLTAFTVWGKNSEEVADRYVGEWAIAGKLLGIDAPPRSVRELDAVMRSFDTHLRYDERAAEVARFLRRPPLPFALRCVYPILFGGAVATMPGRYRNALGLERPRWPAVTLTRGVLALAALVLGRTSPSERAARARIARAAPHSA